MKKLLYLICLLSISILHAQEKEKVTKNVIDETTQDVQVPFNIIENVPVYSGCDENMGNQALKECMSSQISSLVARSFNIKLADKLKLPAGNVRVSVIFKVDKEGNIIDVRARAPHPELEQEAIRVIGLIPKMEKPGFQKGKPVIVPYALPIVFKVKGEKPLTKKEQKRLKKKNR